MAKLGTTFTSGTKKRTMGEGKRERYSLKKIVLNNFSSLLKLVPPAPASEIYMGKYIDVCEPNITKHVQTYCICSAKMPT